MKSSGIGSGGRIARIWRIGVLVVAVVAWVGVASASGHYFVADIVDYSPSNPVVGDTLEVTVEVTNTGSAEDSDFVDLYYDFQDGSSSGYMDYEHVLDLSPGETRTISLFWDTSGEEPGTYNVETQIDYGDGSGEGDTVQVELGNPCAPPASGDWVIDADCMISSDVVVPENVVVENGAVLTITGGSSLGLDLHDFYLLVRSSASVLVGQADRIMHVPFYEDWTNDFTDWTLGGDTRDSGGSYDHEIDTDTYVENGKSIRMYADANCRSSPYDGSEVWATTSVDLDAGVYDLSYSAKVEDYGYYDYADPDKTANEGRVYLNGDPIGSVSDMCTQTDYSGCNSSWISNTETFNVDSSGTHELMLRYSASDCSDSYVLYDDIMISTN